MSALVMPVLAAVSITMSSVALALNLHLMAKRRRESRRRPMVNRLSSTGQFTQREHVSGDFGVIEKTWKK